MRRTRCRHPIAELVEIMGGEDGGEFEGTYVFGRSMHTHTMIHLQTGRSSLAFQNAHGMPDLENQFS